MFTDIAFRQRVAQPSAGRALDLYVLGQQAQLFTELTIKRLLGTFVSFDAALGKLPGVLSDPARPQHLAVVVGQDDADIRPKSIGIDHLAPVHCS